MIFSSLLYPLFLLLAVIVFHALPQRAKPYWITLCGLAFYGFYAGGFLLLIAVEAVGVYILARRAPRFTGVFIVALTAVIGLLAYYKYRLMIFNLIGEPFGMASLSAEHLVIPLALSFYTFEFVHYVVDMRKGSIGKHSFIDFMAFAVFFPTMVAGPIKRFQDFIPKLHGAALAWSMISAGVMRIAIGAAKKIVIADSMNAWVAPLIGGSTDIAATTVITGLLAYSVKIYMDFSGYSDIAIGSALLFGIKVPENFNWPYLAASISDFWKRWHISLTRWIIDYVFIPLGGSRRSPALAITNTLAAMSISGLWHGAAPHFVLWGLYHGLLLSLYRLYRLYARPLFTVPEALMPVSRIGGALLTFILVTLGWGLFIMPAERYIQILKNLL